MLFGCYRRGDANDPDTYVAAISAVLARYEPDLMREVTDPNTGIQTTEKYMSFMPNAGELKVYCEGVAARRERMKRLGSLPAPNLNAARLPPPPPMPGDLATVFVPANNPRYAALVEWSKTANPRLWNIDNRPGISVSYDTWDQRQMAARRVNKAAATEPSRLVLSEDARRAMAAVDAERSGNLPCDKAAAE